MNEKWSDFEINKLRAIYPSKGPRGVHAALPHRSVAAARHVAIKYGIRMDREKAEVAAPKRAGVPLKNLGLQLFKNDDLPRGRVVVRRNGKVIAMVPAGAMALVSAALPTATDLVMHPDAAPEVREFLRREAEARGAGNRFARTT